MAANNFRSYISSLPSNEDENKAPSGFTNALNSKLDKKDKIRNVSIDKDNVILMVDGEGKVSLAHSITNLGGTLRRPKNKVVGIMGLAPRGTGFKFVEKSFANDCVFEAPKLKDYKKCKSKEDLAKIKASNNAEFKESSSFFVGISHGRNFAARGFKRRFGSDPSGAESCRRF